MITTLQTLQTTLRDGAVQDEIVTIDLRQTIAYADYFVICTAYHRRHAAKLLGMIRQELAKEGITPVIERDKDASWTVVDCGDIVLHLFTPQTRRFYRLENLWSMCPQEKLAPAKLAFGA